MRKTVAWMGLALFGCSGTATFGAGDDQGQVGIVLKFPEDDAGADTGEDARTAQRPDAGSPEASAPPEAGADADQCQAVCAAGRAVCGAYMGCDCGACPTNQWCGDNGVANQCGSICIDIADQCANWDSNHPGSPQVPTGHGYHFACRYPSDYDAGPVYTTCTMVVIQTPNMPDYKFWCCP